MPRNPNKIDYSASFPDGFDTFVVIEDPRTGNHKKHHFGEIMFMVITGMLCGMDSFSDIRFFVELEKNWFKRWISLPNGIPSKQTFSNVFQLIDPMQFNQCLKDHVQKLHPNLTQQIIAVDGKALRGSHGLETSAQHCVSAWAKEAGVTLALEYVTEKSNEITAIPKLLSQLELKGHILTLDAMGTQTKIANQIIEQEADYILALKGNQGNLHKEVMDQFYFAARQIDLNLAEKWDVNTQVEKSNGRITTRKTAINSNVEWITEEIREKWTGLKSLIMVETTTTNLDSKKEKKGKRFYISSLDISAEEFQSCIRSHWSIENSCHWVLDVVFQEDKNQTYAENAAKNLGVLRRIVLNILKEDKQSGKISLNKKRLKAAVDQNYREKLLSLA